MGENDIFTINIVTNGVRMPLTIPRKDEEIYRDAEKVLNTYIQRFLDKYSQKSMEEILTLVAFQLAVIIVKQEKEQAIDPLAKMIEALNTELKEIL